MDGGPGAGLGTAGEAHDAVVLLELVEEVDAEVAVAVEGADHLEALVEALPLLVQALDLGDLRGQAAALRLLLGDHFLQLLHRLTPLQHHVGFGPVGPVQDDDPLRRLTGGELLLPPRKRVAFKCSGKLRERINREGR